MLMPVVGVAVRLMPARVMGVIVIVIVGVRVRSHGGVVVGLWALESLEQLQSQVPTLTAHLL